MPDWTDKDTDKLFQDGAEQFDFEFNPAAWAQMEKKLDREKRRRLFWWWWPAGFGVIMLAVIAFMLNRKNLTPQDSLPVGKQSVHASGNLPKNSGETASPQIFPGNQPGTDGAIPKSADAPSLEEKGVLKMAPAGKSGQGAASSGKPLPTATDGQNKVKTPDAPTPVPGPENVGLSISENNISVILKRRDSLQQRSFLPTILIKEVLLGHPVQPSLILPFANKNLLAQNQEEDNGLALIAGIAAGFELSSAGLGDFSRLSWKLGANLEFRYRQRFGLGIGANFIRLNYDAGKGEYIPPKGFWTRKIPPIASRGICQALEIPLDFSYYAGGLKRSGIFASAGLKSYVMLAQQYYYSYDLPDPDLRRMWKTGKNSAYWFAIGQISVGYNKVFSKKTNLAIASYVQVPLSGIGHGNVELYSVGTQVRLGFRLK